MRDLSISHPHLVQLLNVSKSFERRTIWGVKVSNLIHFGLLRMGRSPPEFVLSFSLTFSNLKMDFKNRIKRHLRKYQKGDIILDKFTIFSCDLIVMVTWVL